MEGVAIWFQYIKLAAFIAGLCFGGFAVGSTSWVWLRKQLITVTACWLATLGTGMIGMSIWQSIQIEGPGFRAVLAELSKHEDRMASLAAQNQELASALNTFSIFGVDKENLGDYDRLRAYLAGMKDLGLQSGPWEQVIVETPMSVTKALNAEGYDKEEIERIIGLLLKGSRGG